MTTSGDPTRRSSAAPAARGRRSSARIPRIIGLSGDYGDEPAPAPRSRNGAAAQPGVTGSAARTARLTAARTVVPVRSATRTYRPETPISVHHILSGLRRGGSDPCFRTQPGSPVWRATRTPDGPALLRLVARTTAGEVEATAWGPGSAWVLEGVPDLLGAGDDPSGFVPRPEHPKLVQAWRSRPGYRVPRSRAVFEALVPAALEQRVTGLEARRAWRILVVKFGEPAPGPAPEAAGMYVPPDAATWRQIPSWVWLKAGVDEARRRAVINAAQVAGRLEQTVDLPHDEAARALRTVPGIGIWTAAEVRQRSHGDPDAFSWADYHVSRNVSWALTGTVMDDAGCAEVIECYRGHRYRVQKLLELDAVARPRRAPRMTLPTHLPR
ncbi:DNA-3-methyladenine glycosylase family protein [Kineosporia succinea]|uniref:3-methyladenine DNA glycosylase/8-oxoguanine DNA glycosylase n=1 Tax=Kineosporia succinea TaxID=84632 RepID=A0ABT9NZZ9_9ACTN|nr:DNA-3-methyladenine glycosylase 2 family protein [Kineosporia succinea]MDP9825410.1 3-methyladenine DNA glycosylase/8-oxoguanine DNA glycosylase [Kineosporia succinea]